MVDKQVLREVYLEKRLFLSHQEAERRNELLLSVLKKSLDLSRYKCIHIFLSIVEKKEVDTFRIIKAIRQINPQVEVIASKTLSKGELKHYVLTNQTILKKSKWGIPEPVNAEGAAIDKIELVFVPLISFDKTGHRIGYGKGYYDRFLINVPKAKKIGLSLSPPLDKIEYFNPFDIKLDACITPFKMYEF